MTQTTQLEMYKGDDESFSVTCLKDSAALDLSDGSLKFSAKLNPTSTTALIEKTSAEATEIEITDAEGGLATVYLVPADTESLDAKVYTFDIEFTDSESKVHTLIVGTLNIQQDVSND